MKNNRLISRPLYGLPIAILAIATVLMPSISRAQCATADNNNMKIQSGQLTANNMSHTYVIPQEPEDISPLLIGESIPMLMLKDANGKDFDLNKSVASKPTILVFYRGGWCPYCSKQLAGLQDVLPKFKEMGYQLIAVSTDSPDGLSQSVTKERLDYILLSDADLNGAKKFGIAFKAPKGYWEMLPKTTGGMDQEMLLPVPSVFILDKNGRIHYEYINPDFKQRVSAELLKIVAQTIYKEL